EPFEDARLPVDEEAASTLCRRSGPEIECTASRAHLKHAMRLARLRLREVLAESRRLPGPQPVREDEVVPDRRRCRRALERVDCGPRSRREHERGDRHDDGDVAALRAARTLEDVVPASARLRADERVEQSVEVALGHRMTSFVSASRSVCRAAVSVAPTVPELMPSACAIAAQSRSA